MRIIKNTYKHAETFPLPCWHDDEGILQYDSEVADALVIEAYGEDGEKYDINKNTLELYYKATPKTQFKIAEITYESFFTDVAMKDAETERDFRQEWSQATVNHEDAPDPEDFEIYNITIFHYNHKSLESNQIDPNTNKLTGINTEQYIKSIIKGIQDNQ